MTYTSIKKLVDNFHFNYEFDDDLLAVRKTRGTKKLDKLNYVGFASFEKANIFMYKTKYENFEEVDCNYQHTDTKSTIIKIKVPLDNTIETALKMK